MHEFPPKFCPLRWMRIFFLKKSMLLKEKERKDKKENISGSCWVNSIPIYRIRCLLYDLHTYESSLVNINLLSKAEVSTA